MLITVPAHLKALYRRAVCNEHLHGAVLFEYRAVQFLYEKMRLW